MPARYQPTLRAVALAAVVASSLAGAAQAQPGWGRGWNHAPAYAAPAPDDRAGRVDAERFLADGAAAALGHGRVVVKSLPGSTGDAREQAVYEAAVIDQMARAGYDTLNPAPAGAGQIAELTLSRDELVPAEEKRNPISGSAEMGVSNRGSMMALQLNYDATKPRGALIETRLTLRIRDAASGAPLYEARARIATREGDSHWSDTTLANRLAAAAFEHFPSSGASGR